MKNWTLEDIYFAIRQKDNAVYTSIEEFDIGDEIDNGVLKDERIKLKNKDGNEFVLRYIV